MSWCWLNVCFDFAHEYSGKAFLATLKDKKGDCQKLGVFKNYEIFQKIFFFEKTRKNALNREWRSNNPFHDYYNFLDLY
jgi:hypothetical protein